MEALLLWHRSVHAGVDATCWKGSWHANELVRGPFHIPGIWRILLNAFGVGYVFAFSFFPTDENPDAAFMNWSCLITGTVMLGAVVYCYAVARKVYHQR